MDGARDAVSGIAGVIVWTEAGRFPAMASFYRDVLGCTPRSDRAGFVNFAWGDVRLTVSVHSRVHGPTTEPHRIMVNLLVEDLDRVAARVAALGVAFVRPPETESWGGRVATVADPDGNLVQFMQLAE